MEMTELTKKCNELCDQCIESCRSTMILSQITPGMDKCVRQCMLCIKECEYLMNNFINNWEIDNVSYERCMEACGNCAEECEQYHYDHCRRCAASCRKFQLTYIFKANESRQTNYQNDEAVNVQSVYNKF